MKNSNLKKTILYGADLSGADLRNANLEGASLDMANLSFVNLSSSKIDGITANNLQSCPLYLPKEWECQNNSLKRR